MTAQSTYSITAHDLVQQRNVELGEAISELIRAYQYGPNLYTGRTIAQLHRINADVGRAIDQLGAAVATRDGFSACQSIGPDVALPVGGQGR